MPNRITPIISNPPSANRHENARLVHVIRKPRPPPPQRRWGHAIFPVSARRADDNRNGLAGAVVDTPTANFLAFVHPICVCGRRGKYYVNRWWECASSGPCSFTRWRCGIDSCSVTVAVVHWLQSTPRCWSGRSLKPTVSDLYIRKLWIVFQLLRTRIAGSFRGSLNVHCPRNITAWSNALYIVWSRRVLLADDITRMCGWSTSRGRTCEVFEMLSSSSYNNNNTRFISNSTDLDWHYNRLQLTHQNIIQIQ